jgi:hypothetical protein
MATRDQDVAARRQLPRDRNVSLHLLAPKVHDFSDLRGEDVRPGSPLRWVLAIAALLTLGNLVLELGRAVSRTQAAAVLASGASSD